MCLTRSGCAEAIVSEYLYRVLGRRGPELLYPQSHTVKENCRADMNTHPFIIYVILYLHYRFLSSITCLCCCKRKCLGVPLHVLKLMSLILVRFELPCEG